MGQERVPQGVGCPEQSAVATSPVIHLACSLLASCPWKHELPPRSTTDSRPGPVSKGSETSVPFLTRGSNSSTAHITTHRHTWGLRSGTRSEPWHIMVFCLHWRKLGGLSGEGGWVLLVFTPCGMYVPRKMPKLCCRRALCERETISVADSSPG